MARRPFIRKKKNETKNREAIDTFRTFNRLAPSSREKYIKEVLEFADFLLVHRKSLWDSDFEDLKKFFLENDSKPTRTVISTFYRVLIDSGEFKRENPVIQLNRIEREERKLQREAAKPVGRAATVLQELDDHVEEDIDAPIRRVRKKRVSKRIMMLSDLDRLIKRASHIRDRAILEFLYATGAQIQEAVNLNVSDVDLEARKVTIHSSGDRFRTLILPRRTVNFLKVYERWRRRQFSPDQAYYLTKSTRKRMSDSSISTWLNRIQRDIKDEREKFTAMDFRKRAILQHYWITRDLTAIARFGGYKRPESALNLISEILIDQGVDSIDKLATLPEFEALRSEGKKIASIGEADQMTITIQLDKDEMDIIRNSGLTPTQAVKTIISLKDLYGAFAPGGGSASSVAKTTMSPSTSTGPKPGGGTKPAGMPIAAKGGGVPKLSLGPGGPSLGEPAKAPSLSGPSGGGPSLGGPSNSGPTPAGPSGPDGDAGMPGGAFEFPTLTKAPSSDPTDKPTPGGAGAPAGGGGGPMDQLSELKAILARRKAKADAPSDEEKAPERPGLDATIVNTNDPLGDDDKRESLDKDDEDDDDDEDDVPDMPAFDF